MLVDLNEKWPPYFGEKWDAPVTDDGFKVDTPIGKKCWWCEEKIEQGDRGFFTLSGIPQVDLVEIAGRQVVPIHLECQIRSVMGGVNHLKGTCSCQGGEDQPDPENLSKREAAKQSYHYLEQRYGSVSVK